LRIEKEGSAPFSILNSQFSIRRVDVVVIGAGPAGLATSRELSRRGVAHVVYERGEVADTWSRLYDSLTLHTGKHMSHLPGMRFARTAALFLSRAEFFQYLHEYQRRFDVPVRTRSEVTSVTREDGGWRVVVNGEPVSARAVVVATGIVANPRTPSFPGMSEYRGTMRHSITYRNPDELRGRRVLVVGAGNSAGEIAGELGRAGIDTTVAIRSGAHIVPLTVMGIPIQYVAYSIRMLPLRVREALTGVVQKISALRRGPSPIPKPSYGPLEAIPLIGFGLADAIRNGTVKLRGGIERFTTTGVRFFEGIEEPFDEILLATGFDAALGFLGPLVRSDAKGFAMRRDRVISEDQPDLYFVGHNYDPSGGLTNIRRDSALAAEEITRSLRRT